MVATVYYGPYPRYGASTADLNTVTWGNWCQVTTMTTAAATNGEIWARWTTTSGTYCCSSGPVFTESRPQSTGEPVSQRQERARQLLQELLNAEQWHDYQGHAHFTVTGSSGRRFRIRYGTVGNVTTVDDDGYPLVAYCAHPELYDSNSHQNLPTEDVLVAQALALMTDDEAFLAVANVHEVYPRARTVAA